MRTAGPGDANDRTTVERRDPLVGTILDQRFHIERQLAAGGFGAIYRATDQRHNIEVALKVLHPRMARDPMVVARFRREGATLSNLRDPHTIEAYELGEAPDGTLYIVMELLHGESLYEQFHANGPLPWRRVVHIARGVCSSLAEAHASGIIHRDLKPSNIHLERRGDDLDFVKVLDFGIAKIVQGAEYDRNDLTQAGHMIGTVDYMSPEQMVGGEMTACSDIYTLGVVIYEMISGRTPFADAKTPTAILAAVLTRTADPLSRHVQVPPALDQLVARCLARDLQHRFANVAELDRALAEVEMAGLARPGLPSAPERVGPGEHVTMAFVRQLPEFAVEVPTTPEEPTTAAAPISVRPTPVEFVGGLPRRSSPAELVPGTPARPTPGELPPRGPARPTPVEFVGGLPARSAPTPPAPMNPVVARPSAAVPTSGFEETILTSDATRIDVRFTDSSEPVLDARGPRARMPGALPPANVYTAGPVTPPSVSPVGSHVQAVEHARGSQHAIEARSWQPVPPGRGALPMNDLAAQPAPVGPSPLAASPLAALQPAASQPAASPLAASRPAASQLAASQPAPPQPAPPQHASLQLATPQHASLQHATPQHATPQPRLEQTVPQTFGPPPIAPPVRASTHEVPSYDMAAAASYDALVRRIIWISLIVAVIIGALIATR